ncbi:MAG TPA: hypothetical protein VMV03_00785 [Spirochaetia bacterium]|nr:hypothetical protein [Spirochaetia bacterium]
MVGIGLGAASLGIILWVDLISLKGIRFAKPLLWLAATAVFVLAVVLTVRSSPRIPLPPLLPVLGYVLAGLFFLLLVWSLFIEIPFLSAYVESRGSRRLVTSGTYALCRHPGVLWLGGLIAGMFLASGALLLAPAFLVWIGLDFLLVYLQERLFFLRLFGPDYRKYQREVPMVIPTLGSLQRCIHTLRR